MEVHGALNGGLLSLPWGKRDGLGLVWEIEDKEESVQMSLTASSDDFCSREISEFEKLLCLQIRTKKMQISHLLHTPHCYDFSLWDMLHTLYIPTSDHTPRLTLGEKEVVRWIAGILLAFYRCSIRAVR